MHGSLHKVEFVRHHPHYIVCGVALLLERYASLVSGDKKLTIDQGTASYVLQHNPEEGETSGRVYSPNEVKVTLKC